MEMDRIKPRNLPKDARWQDFIPKLKCPQCQIYTASSPSHLERHIILHCKSRNSLLRSHYIRKLKALSSQVEEDPVELVRLTLEAKLLQWEKDGIPEIPLLLKHNPAFDCQESEKNTSSLLDLWRLWIQEVDSQCLEYDSSSIIQLLTQAEALDWEPSDESTLPVPIADDQMNSELMNSTFLKLKDMLVSSIKQCVEEIDATAIERLENEAFLLATISK